MMSRARLQTYGKRTQSNTAAAKLFFESPDKVRSRAKIKMGSKPAHNMLTALVHE
jgi:hypothetical protein